MNIYVKIGNTFNKENRGGLRLMNRGKRYKRNSLDKRKVFYVIGVGVFIALLVLIFVLSGYNAKKQADFKIAEMQEIEPSDATMVSTTEDRSINEVQEQNKITKETEKIAINTSALGQKTTTNSTAKDEKNEPIVEEKKPVELHFIVPVEGEISKDYSDSNLTYSETLQEWTVHLGIDINAEKGSPVVASEMGKVESIKNDPRYGTTVTIVHENGFKTIYSNLQTAEFVAEGQDIEKEQILGSVGDNAPFEIADEAHLHFEMTKDGESINPSNYWGK